jgi:ABC-2 type transport system ATP-binding protein
MERVFRECIEEVRGDGRTVLLSSHILSEVEALCDTVSIIRAGRTVETGTLGQLRHLTRTSIEATFATPPAIAAVRAIPGLHDPVLEGAKLSASVDTDQVGAVLAALGPREIIALTSQPPTLEELFMRSYSS